MRKLKESGFDTWVVGGAIRDAVLAQPIEDWDLATLARPNQIREVFPRTIPIGLEHGTVGVLGRDGTLYEVTTFRKDVENFGRHAVVEFSENIEEDLARRDFTLNSMAWNPDNGVILDPFEGRKHIAQGILKTVGLATERFSEDYLRVLRALRFAGQFDLEIEVETWDALLSAVPQLHRLSSERIQEEIVKVLSKAEFPSKTLNYYAVSGVIAKLYPEFCDAEGSFDPQKFSFSRSVLFCDAIAPRRPLLRLALLLTSVGPDERTDSDTAKCLVENLMQRLRFSNTDTKRTARLVWSFLLDPPVATGQDCRVWLNWVGPDLFNDICRMWIAAARVKQGDGANEVENTLYLIRFIRKLLKDKPPLTLRGLAVDGNDLQKLGVPPGPSIGRILEELLVAVLKSPELNTHAGLMEIVKEMGNKN